ncbi:hypothetical protein [Dellaglioa carnosa]|uniref:Uncharacterized protein n=1 Tax=Dellaglioa carnosa TaxID=2995136 RepID=A0ABT4JJW8_9LACO|nr:hypothetical protein [Dellaglioa carnosa]MCZ2490659.1 hypothetical protein [Dellaglioa carnosa]MCZ2493737.1 hypothetical protein [Dellaglioa carnosa]MDK1730601.1 hypothetical protein [Dellaglioa carnosa]
MQVKKRNEMSGIVEKIFPTNSVSIVLDQSSEFTNQLLDQNLLHSKLIELITVDNLKLLVPYLSVTQNMSLTQKNYKKEEKSIISKLIYGHHFNRHSPNFMDKKITSLNQMDRAIILLFRAVLNNNSIIILTNLIDTFSITETRFFIDFVTELTFQLNLRIIITTNQPELLTQPQVTPFNKSPLIK